VEAIGPPERLVQAEAKSRVRRERTKRGRKERWRSSRGELEGERRGDGHHDVEPASGGKAKARPDKGGRKMCFFWVGGVGGGGVKGGPEVGTVFFRAAKGRGERTFSKI